MRGLNRTLSACSNASQMARPTSFETSQFVPEPSLWKQNNEKRETDGECVLMMALFLRSLDKFSRSYFRIN